MSTASIPERAARSIPGILRKFIERASVAVGCTRDSRNVPLIHWVSAWELDPDLRSLWCHIPASFTPGLAENLDDNGLFALTLEQIGPHETYQFKGRVLERRPSGPADRTAASRARERFASDVVALFPHLLPDQDALRRYILDPGLSLRLAVREIYLQTPGPGAGSLLARLEGAP